MKAENDKANFTDIHHTWCELTDLPSDWTNLTTPQLALVADLWRSRLTELRGSSVLTEFNARLARQWSIETGVIEGVYRIDRGVTQLLIERGLESALIPHGTTDRPAEDIVEILKDHNSALEGLFAFVGSERPLSISYVRELHQELCKSQHVVKGQDQFGNAVERILQRGEFKSHRNSPLRADGKIHEYCPPEHVGSEMDRLVELHLKHTELSVAPEVEAAWLHHRFTQVHPFEDGNGRVARALASLVLLRAKLFPFIVEREDYGKYLDALEAADQGDLQSLVTMIAQQQQQTLIKALDLSRDVMRDSETVANVEDALENAVTRIHAREMDRRQQQFQTHINTAKELADIAYERMDVIGKQFYIRLQHLTTIPHPYVQQSRDDQSYWFRHQVIKSARELGYFANTNAWHHWVRLVIPGDPEAIIVLSFHQSGHVFRGYFMCSAFFEFKGRDEDGDERNSVRLGKEAFVISMREESDKMKSRFRIWLNDILAIGLQEYSEGV